RRPHPPPAGSPQPHRDGLAGRGSPAGRPRARREDSLWTARGIPVRSDLVRRKGQVTMSLNTVSILDGNSFVVSDRRGDIDASPIDTQGLFLDDTRFLSRWILTVNGMRPTVLSVDEQEYFQVQFFEAVTTSTIYVDSHLSVARKRAVGKGFHEEILVENHDKKPMDLDIQDDVAADFANLFEVKDKLQKKGELYAKATNDRLTLGYKRDRYVRETYISANQKGQVDEKGFHFKVHL